LIRPPLADLDGAGRRPSNPRSNGGPSNPKSTVGGMYSSRSDGAAGGQPRSSSSRRSMGALARDLSRSMSRSLASIGATMGRAVRDAGRYEPPQYSSASRRVELPPDVMEQIAENAQPYRRSRARMLARKWRLGRVRANPIGYAAGIAALITLLFITVGVGGVGATYGVGVYDKHRADIQNIYNLKFGQSTQIFDRNGVLLYTARNNDGVNIYLGLDQISKKVQDATIDTEDPSFYSNIGVDFYGLLRAVVSNTSSGDTTGQGGSTITQQLVKRIVLKDSDKTYQRKLNEMFLAYGVTANYEKKQILEMYLNSIDYGDLNQGIEAAARNFFGIQPDSAKGLSSNQQLSWAQTALLVALPNSPSRYLPYQFSCDSAPCDESKWDNPCLGNPHDAVCVPNPKYSWQAMGHEWLDYRRGLLVLDKLHQYNNISDKDYADAKTELHDILTGQKVYHQAGSINTTGNGQNFGKRAPLFVDYIFDQLTRDFGVENPERAGLRIYTTLDYSITEYAEKQLKYYILEPHDIRWPHYCGKAGCKNVPSLAQTANAHNGAMVAIDPHNGDIISFVGSVDYGNPDKRIAGYIDMTGATYVNGKQVMRSMGSSAKGVIYTTAFQLGWNPATMMQDQPICFDQQTPLINDPGKPDNGQKTHDDFAPSCDGLYVPHNFEDTSFSGNIPIRFALGSSLNVPATEAMTFISGSTSRQGDTLESMASRVGITSWSKGLYGPSTALGTINMPMIQLASFYATIADGGVRHPYRSILRIETADGTPLYQAAANPKGEQVVSPQAAYMLTSVLTDDNARLPVFNDHNPLSFPDYPVAAKTGTAQGLKGPSDIVTMGYSPYLAMGVWMGNTDNTDMAANTIGIAGAGYVFSDVMQWAIDNYKWPKVTGFPIPDKMARGQFNCVTGLAPFQGETIAPCKLNAVTPGSVNLYIGYGGDSRVNEDWYIKGQEPLES
jgi:membrane peptidoglycan carboxypeptidase